MMPGLTPNVCALVVVVVIGSRNVEMGTALSVGPSINVPCSTGIIDGGSGFVGTSER